LCRIRNSRITTCEIKCSSHRQINFSNNFFPIKYCFIIRTTINNGSLKEIKANCRRRKRIVITICCIGIITINKTQCSIGSCKIITRVTQIHIRPHADIHAIKCCLRFINYFIFSKKHVSQCPCAGISPNSCLHFNT